MCRLPERLKAASRYQISRQLSAASRQNETLNIQLTTETQKIILFKLVTGNW
jgi:hypothetical protein